MSAVVGEPGAGGAQKYVNFDEYVEFQVNKTRAGIRYADLLFALVTVLLVAAGYLLLFVLADHWLVEGGLSDRARTVLLSCVTVFIAGWTTWKIILPYWKRVTALYAAQELETTQPLLKSSLLTLVDLKQAGRPVAPHILTAMEKRAALQLSQIDVEQAVDRRPLMRLAYALFGVLVVFCLYTVLSPKPIGPSLLRALIPIADVGVATRTRIVKVDPGATTILARSQLVVTVDLEGEIPPEATLLYTTGDRSLVDEPVVLRDTGEGLHRFRGTLSGPNGRGLLQDFQYRIAAGDAESESYEVSVRQAPYATIESVTYAFPAYMGLDAKTQTGGDIDAWEGTQVTIRGSANMPVAGATLKFHDSEDTTQKGEELLMRLVDETHFEVTWTLQFRNDGTFAKFYRIDLRTAEGQRDPVPRLYTHNLRRDLPPEITLLHPTGDLELPANAVLPLSYTARDPDFMLRSIRMRFEQRELALNARTRHLFDAPPYRPEVTGRGELKLSDFALQPGDVLTFYLEAWDNMSPLGPKEGNRTVTPKINITIASPATPEQVKQLKDEAEQAAQQRLEEAAAQENAERGAAEAGADDSEAQEPPMEPGNASGDTETNPGEPPAGDQQEAPGTNAGEESAQPEQGDSGTSPPQPMSEQPSDANEQSPQTAQEQQQSQGDGKSGQQSQNGKSQSANKGANQQGDTRGQSGASSPSRSRPQPGEEASDDEALSKLLKKYEEDIKEAEKKQQAGQPPEKRADDGSSEKSQAGDQQGDQGEPQQQSGDKGQSRSDGTSGDSDPEGSDASPPGETDRPQSEGRKPQEGQKPQESPGDANRGDEGDASQPDSGDPENKGGNEQRSTGETPEPTESTADPREKQAPQSAPQNNRERGAEEGTSKPQDQPEATAGEQGSDSDASQPMPGEGNQSKSTSPSGQSPPGDSKNPSNSASQPSSEQPTGEKPDGDQTEGDGAADEGQPQENRDANADGKQQRGEPNKPGARDANDSKPSKTGGQPKDANEQNPGEGRKDGQRSEKPETGEQGSSTETSEGQSSSETGAGDPSTKPGSKMAGESGQQSPGEGKQAGENQPGEQQPGSGSESPGGQEGSESSPKSGAQQPGAEEGDSQSPSDSGQKGANDDGKQGENPQGDQSSEPGDTPPDGKQPGEKGAKGARQSKEPQQPGDEGVGGAPGEKSEQPPGEKPGGSGETGEEKGGEKGGEPPSDDKGDEQPSGGEKSGGEKSGGEKSGGEKSGGEKSGGEKSGGEKSGGEQGKGEEGGGQEGGGKSGGEESGGGQSDQPGDAPQLGKPGTGQPTGGAVGAGGSGQSRNAPPGSGGGGAGEAGSSEPADLSDRKRATELVLQKLQDELSRGDVSPELLQDLGWTEKNLREFMDRLDRRLSDTGEDQSPEAEARRRQFHEILRGIDYQSEGRQKTADARDRPVAAGAGTTTRLPAPSEFRSDEESFRQKLSRETRSKAPAAE